MNQINKFFLRDVRCFGGAHEFDIRPLTFLVGENSTGKSTLLGCLQALGNLPRYRNFFWPQIDFNCEPYQMGTFANIARRSTPGTKDFQLGIEYGIEKHRVRIFLTLTEKDKGSEPIVSQIRWAFEEGEITFSINEGVQDQKNGFKVTHGKNQNEFHISINKEHCHSLYSLDFSQILYMEDLDNICGEFSQFIKRQSSLPYGKKGRGARQYEFLRKLHAGLYKIHSIAPIRSKPKRTYDPLKETETPDGSEIPMTLRNLKASREQEWEDLKKQLVNFGRDSGLFSDIELRELGDSRGDPFQLKVEVRGSSANLMDAGYGVSQVLPVLVHIFRNRGTRFLLQQPEVHLHPKGQAELVSLFVDNNRTHKNSFVIETHSDYMIDRIRIEIMKGKIKPEDVSLIYLEPVGNQVKTHNICFDAQANMINVPDGYRDFFLKELDELLGFTD